MAGVDGFGFRLVPTGLEELSVEIVMNDSTDDEEPLMKEAEMVPEEDQFLEDVQQEQACV